MKIAFLLLSLLTFSTISPNQQLTGWEPLHTPPHKKLSTTPSIIEQNIQTATIGIENTKRKIAILEKELLELELLEKGYQKLQIKYVQQIDASEKELQENNNKLIELKKKVKEPRRYKTGNKTTKSISVLHYTLEEKKERIQWNKKVENKFRIFASLLATTKDNLNWTMSRKHPLINEIQSQKQKESEYNNLIQDLNAEKREPQQMKSSK